jgi:NhaP-type Na+/H+ or K+/H+ antiporter
MEESQVFLTAVLGLGLAAQWLAWRLRMPAILLLLVFGFCAGLYFGGPEEYIPPELLFPVVSLSVAMILFEGGLSLRIADLRGIGRAVFGLLTVGIAVSWVLTAAAARWLLGFPLGLAALLGAVLVVSGPTVIMPLLRHVRPNRRVSSIVKWEGIVNDPIGAILAFLMFYALTIGGFERPLLGTLAALTLVIVVGGLMGLVAAILLVQSLRRYWIPDYLQNTTFLTAVVVTFWASNRLLPESGLVAVTVFGIVLANQKAVTVKHVIEFKENLRVLLISCLFILLAAQLKPGDLSQLGWGGLLFLAALVLVVRPVAVFLATARKGLHWRERVFLAWIHPRGIVAAAVCSIFALELAHLPGLSPEVAESIPRLVPVTFLVIVGTVAIYGLTAGPLARWLNISDADPQGILFAGADLLAREIALLLDQEGYAVLLVDTNQRNVDAARMAGLDTCWANACSEYAREELDLGGIGRLLAMTPNDEANSLAAAEFAELFGRAEVYQLPPKPAEIEHLRLAHQRVARVLFDADAHYWRLAQRLAGGPAAGGAVVKKTVLTDEFDYQAFRDLYGDSALLLFVIEGSGKLTVCTPDGRSTPRPGQTLISLMDK